MKINKVFDEVKRGEEYFTLKDPKTRKYIFDFFKQAPTSYPTFFKLVCNYLAYELNLKNNPLLLKKVLIKYSFVFASCTVYDSNNENENPFYVLFENGLTIESLLSFKSLKDDKLSQSFNEGKYLFNKEEQEKNNYGFHNILNVTKDFYTQYYDINSYIKGIDKKIPIDLLIANSLNSKYDPIYLSFSLDDENYDKIRKNIIDKEVGPVIEYIFFLLNEYIKQKTEGIITREIIFYRVLARRGGNKMSPTKIKFIAENEASNQRNLVYHIQYQLVEEFSFTLNDKKYSLSKDGLICE